MEETNSRPRPPAGQRGGPRQGWAAGVGVIASTSPYRGNHPVFVPIPMLSYVGERLSVTGPKVAWRLGRAAGTSLSAVASYQFAGLLSRQDDKYFDGMHDPRGTVEAGLELQVPLPGGLRGQVTAKTDMLGVFDGQEVGLSLSRRLTFGDWSVSPGVGGAVLSEKMADYYFGVRAEEARADRPAYSPEAAVMWGPRLMIQWRVTERVGFISLCSVDVLGSEITGSPLIEETVVVSTMTGFSWQF